MAYTFDNSIVSDLHKDAYGFRPSSYFWDDWKASTDDQKQVIWDGLLRDLDAEMERERNAQLQAVADFEAMVQSNLDHGAQSREDAVRWVVQGLGLDEMDLRYGGSRVCYELGLPFAMETLFDGICEELRDKLEIAA
jgi:hypothetical protein